ncbi:MAG TPA: hypothetical protein DIU41_06520 [Oscillibacter sp.]|nr:hypothetical protein [Oscillibacter sp.]
MRACRKSIAKKRRAFNGQGVNFLFTAREGDAPLVNTNLTKETAENYGQKEPRIRFSDSGTQMSQKTKYKKTSFLGGKGVQIDDI